MDENYNKTCRICLQPVGKSYSSIFDSIQLEKGELKIHKMITDVFPSLGQASPIECLPKLICSKCVETFKYLYRIKEQCQRNRAILQRILDEHETAKYTRHQQYRIYCPYFKHWLQNCSSSLSSINSFANRFLYNGKAKNPGLQCAKCAYKFRDSDDAKKHENSGECTVAKLLTRYCQRGFICQGCNEIFTTPSKLKEHSCRSTTGIVGNFSYTSNTT